MLLIDQINWLVLGNLHTCAYITFPMKKECECTGQMLTRKRQNEKLSSIFLWEIGARDRNIDGTQLYFIEHPPQTALDDINKHKLSASCGQITTMVIKDAI